MNDQRDDRTHRMSFRTALDALQLAAGGALSPDATQGWRSQVEPICRRIEGRWEPYRQRLRGTFREIERNDLALAAQVGELRAGRRQLEQRWLTLSSRLRELPDAGPGSESPPNATKILGLRKDLREWARSALQLDSAAASWLLESVNRERGGSG